MPIRTDEVSIVMQGGLNVGYDVRYAARYMRTVFPGAPIILSTQEKEAKNFDGQDDFDVVVTTPDPGPMPGLKFNDGGIHNINRQRASSAAGLSKVQTPYAIKLRTDGYFASTKILDYWSAWEDAPRGPTAKGRGRIMAMSIFSVNPTFDERFAYHLSDFVHFGHTEDVLRLWNCPEYDFDTATWYERHSYADGSLPREREHRSRISSEQWTTLHNLFGTDLHPIRYTNDISPSIIEEFYSQLVDNYMIVHPFDIDLILPKFRGFLKNPYFNTICFSHEDWKRIIGEKRGLSRGTTGYTRWPRTDREKKFFMFVRTDPRCQWLMDRIPGRTGHRVRRLFYG